MKPFKLTEHTSPADVFKHQENLRADREWAGLLQEPKLPVYKKCENIRLTVGWMNLLKTTLKELKP